MLHVDEEILSEVEEAGIKYLRGVLIRLIVGLRPPPYIWILSNVIYIIAAKSRGAIKK